MRILFHSIFRLVVLSVIFTVPSMSWAKEGGANGGGGSTLPPRYVQPWQIRKIVIGAKANLVPLIKARLQSYGEGEDVNPVEKKLFGGKPNLYDVLVSTDLDIVYDRPCKDRFGRWVDASIYSPRNPNAICLSAARIATKLEAERAETEILALILHELSHKLGTTEVEARDLQKDLVLRVSMIGAREGHKDYFQKVKTATDELHNLAWRMDQEATGGANKVSVSDLVKLGRANRNFFSEQMSYPRSLLDDQEHAFYSVQSLRLSLITRYFLSKSDPDLQNELGRRFDSAKSKTFREYSAAFPTEVLTKNMRYGEEVVRVPQNDEEALLDLKSILPFFTRVGDIQGLVGFGTTPRPLPLPEYRQSPFKKFEGRYQIKSSACSDGQSLRGVTGYEIVDYAQGFDLQLIQNFANGYGTLGGLHTGSATPFGGSHVSVSGTGTSATRTEESFNRWGTDGLHEFWQTQIRLAKKNDGAEMMITWLGRKENHQTNKLTDAVSSCTLQLELVP